jgi:DNA-directed RNA polymerase sigma subunit (sigma70/sigma32)
VQHITRPIVEAHLGLVRAEAARFGRMGVLGFDDLVQEGTLGLMAAARRFDPDSCRIQREDRSTDRSGKPYKT